MNVFLCWMVVLIQGNQHLSIGGPDCAVIAVSHIDATVRHTDIVENRGDLVLWHLATNLLLDLVNQPRRLFNPQTCPSSHVQAELSGINPREEIPTQEKDQSSGSDAKRQKHRNEDAPMKHH